MIKKKTAFRAHVAGRLSDPDQSRARTRLAERGFLTLLQRLHGRAGTRGFEANAAECFFFQAEDGIRDRDVTGVQTVCSSDLRSARSTAHTMRSARSGSPREWLRRA